MAKCLACNSHAYYVGLNSCECSNPKCQWYTPPEISDDLIAAINVDHTPGVDSAGKLPFKIFKISSDWSFTQDELCKKSKEVQEDLAEVIPLKEVSSNYWETVSPVPPGAVVDHVLFDTTKGSVTVTLPKYEGGPLVKRICAVLESVDILLSPYSVHVVASYMAKSLMYKTTPIADCLEWVATYLETWAERILSKESSPIDWSTRPAELPSSVRSHAYFIRGLQDRNGVPSLTLTSERKSTEENRTSVLDELFKDTPSALTSYSKYDARFGLDYMRSVSAPQAEAQITKELVAELKQIVAEHDMAQSEVPKADLKYEEYNRAEYHAPAPEEVTKWTHKYLDAQVPRLLSAESSGVQPVYSAGDTRLPIALHQSANFTPCEGFMSSDYYSAPGGAKHLHVEGVTLVSNQNRYAFLMTRVQGGYVFKAISLKNSKPTE